MNSKGIELIKKYESCRLEAYKCPAGVWTIGYGHTDGVKEGMKITQKEADAMLLDDIRLYEKQTKALLKVKVNENQFAALTSFCFNLGAGNLKNSTLLKKVNANPNDPTIAGEFAKWVFSKGVILNGLVKRRSEEADLYFNAT